MGVSKDAGSLISIAVRFIRNIFFSHSKGTSNEKPAAVHRNCAGPGRLTMIIVTCRLTMIFFTYRGRLNINNYCRDVE